MKKKEKIFIFEERKDIEQMPSHVKKASSLNSVEYLPTKTSLSPLHTIDDRFSKLVKAKPSRAKIR